MIIAPEKNVNRGFWKLAGVFVTGRFFKKLAVFLGPGGQPPNQCQTVHAQVSRCNGAQGELWYSHYRQGCETIQQDREDRQQTRCVQYDWMTPAHSV